MPPLCIQLIILKLSFGSYPDKVSCEIKANVEHFLWIANEAKVSPPEKSLSSIDDNAPTPVFSNLSVDSNLVG